MKEIVGIQSKGVQATLMESFLNYQKREAKSILINSDAIGKG